MKKKSNQIGGFQNFSEAIRTRDLSSIPGKIPGEEDYITNVTNRAKTRLGIEGEREGNIGIAIEPLMRELRKSQSLSRGYEEELSQLAERVIIGLYKPIIDSLDIKLDIKFETGPAIRRMLDDGFANIKPLDTTLELSPTIKARGVDFSMLIHEAVKGIWKVMSLGKVPDDPELALAIEKEFGLSDEPDEWRYGPEIAGDLRDFINENPKVNNYNNVRERVWRYMVNENNLPNDDFLFLMKGILSKTPEARKKIDSIIDIVIIKIQKIDQYAKDLAKYNFEMAEYERKMEERNKRKNTPESPQSPQFNVKKETRIKGDYSQMSQKELSDELSKALDARDFATVEIISQYIK